MTRARKSSKKQQNTIEAVFYSSPVGLALLAFSQKGLCFLQFGTNSNVLKQSLAEDFPKAEIRASDEHQQSKHGAALDALAAYFIGRSKTFDIPLDLRGSEFQLTVWNQLLKVPYGQTASYKGIATALDRPQAVRAVASAVASNRIAVVIPCHRIIRSDGRPSGYRWGTQRKQYLLELEARNNR